jgi:RNA polymerase sigma-70 factor (ECF subfamily)
VRSYEQECKRPVAILPLREVLSPVDEPVRRSAFERTFLPHLPAAFNLARWLTRDGSDAEDVVQEAYLRAWRAFDRFRGGDGRPWLLTIVRNTALTWLRQHRRSKATIAFDESLHGRTDPATQPAIDGDTLRFVLEGLPDQFREVVVLRELEGLTYKEVAEVTGVPIGTVMSRLSRARGLLRERMAGQEHGPG